MVKFSIIIVSYNVKYFLEQCLCSVKKAIVDWSVMNSPWDTEVFVVDNHSSDESIEYLKPHFPFIKFISNHENKGFAKANNQALPMATGQHILFLNPDTILPEDFFIHCINHLETNPRIGGLGVLMIDGKGVFLKESKRGYPTPWACFCKLSGLTALFPHSRFFAQYYLGHLNHHSSQEVESISGACMFIKKEALDKTGGFDERFFMYAEDIDLSYRIQQAGYTIYYLANTSIIHFKGESTTKDTRYVKLFYKAMIQFVQKHYSGTTGRLYAVILSLAIWLHAMVAFSHLQLAKRIRKRQPENSRMVFSGDEHSIEESKSLLPVSGDTRSIPTAGGSTEIVFCEGQHLSFREIIKIMKLSPFKNYKIHSLHSCSVVGSGKSYAQSEHVFRNDTDK